MNKIKQIYNRRYTKIQTTLYNVGGIVKSLFILAQIICWRLSFRTYETVISAILHKRDKCLMKYSYNLKEKLNILRNNFMRTSSKNFSDDLNVNDSQKKLAMLERTPMKIKKESQLRKIFCSAKSINTIKNLENY
jgi:hypothetical protein